MATQVAQPKMANLRKRRFPYTPVAWGFVSEKCQRRKIKCSGEHPCKGCREGDHECVYLRSTRFRASRRFSTGTSTQSSEEGQVAAEKDQWHSAESISKRHQAEPAANPSLSDRLGNSDYYIRLAERRLVALSPEQSNGPRQSHHRHIIGSETLRDLVKCRGKPGAVLAMLDLEYWVEALSIYEEEIGLQYPFLDINELKHKIKLSKQSSDVLRTNGCERIEDTALIIYAIVSMLAEHAAIDIINASAEEIFTAAVGRTQLNGADKDELSVIILCSIFFFLSDREIRAWRGISVVMRLIQELTCTNSEEMDAQPSSQLKEIGEKVYWTVYTLDRRWSFGTGMPFAVQDSDITQHPGFIEDSLSSSYLKNMVAYCNIASEVRRSVLDASIKQPTVSESTRDFLNFRVVQWQRNLPSQLQFRGVGDKLDESKESRGEYKMRLVLYLRANQMRTLIYRKLAVQAERNNFSPSSANIMGQIAQDTLRILIDLARETTIYHTQHKTFNHFLETALSSLLLVMCCPGVTQTVSCLGDVIEAIELVQQLSTQSPITRRLGDKLQGIQDVVRNLQSQTQNSRQFPANATDPGPSVHRGSLSLSKDNGSNSGSKAKTNLESEASIGSCHSALQVSENTGSIPEVTQVAYPDSHQPTTTQTNYANVNKPNNEADMELFPPVPGPPNFDLDAPIDSEFDLDQDAPYLDDTRLLQIPELGDILRDYDYFGF
ncbi:hypothetical protein BGZ63DRAFT_426613 [Mariannaea sp. PMI_226]|nr:hypothetical protein BGZ63DRAFT_426613 [Mariannaea sp. PMI_226]